ncbi:MAG: hypothetical protein JXJ19_02150 [Elusimicrobia bacterium]|nr:hypothetical protein [Elusimicrobiota bacterium]
MKKYVCQVCGHVNLLNELPDKCPVCGAPRKSFSEKEDALKLPADPGNMTELEKKHVPLITVNRSCSLAEGCLDVHARMGEIVHPMLPEHYITFVDFYLDDKFLARLHLTPEKLNPAGCIHMKAGGSGKLTVIESCNIHGKWISETAL